ncbi:DUF397 domain-containing protein [Streptomyces sp. NPDC020412]|uniref:DUF397 domain-containing protein n=1 Tax=Streptomyces sp. NPDC020412 TaxID=3365073 RepID=UPI003792FC1A
MTTAPTAQLAGVNWTTSTYSAPNNECVEVARVPDGSLVGVRDSKDRTRAALTVSGPSWTAVVDALRTGAL